jgi:hypothetical protein
MGPQNKGGQEFKKKKNKPLNGGTKVGFQTPIFFLVCCFVTIIEL